jgi:hypothetical protein
MYINEIYFHVYFISIGPIFEGSFHNIGKSKAPVFPLHRITSPFSDFEEI